MLKVQGSLRPPKQSYFPTRNYPLNIRLGGGIMFGAVNEISGDPGLGKTMFCCEAIVDMTAAGGYAIVCDREGMITSGRLDLLGKPNYDRIFYFANQPELLTVEASFRLTTGAWNTIRADDCKKVVDKLTGKKPPKKLVERYRAIFRMPADSTPAAIAKNLYGTMAKEKVFYHQFLDVEDRSEILWVVDSLSSMPGQSEVAGDKFKSKVLANQQLQILSGEGGSAAQAQQARSWSTALRNQRFLDQKVVGIWTAQMRMTVGSMNNWYRSEAEPGANEFYGRARLRLSPMGGKESNLHLDPSSGNLLYSVGDLPYQDTLHPVGRRVWMTASKVTATERFRVPWFWLGSRGTDTVNTVWEFLVDQGILVSKRAPNFTVADAYRSVEGVDPEMFDTTITRASFMESLYSEFVESWSALTHHLVRSVVQL